jgi:hypothetical protein
MFEESRISKQPLPKESKTSKQPLPKKSSSNEESELQTTSRLNNDKRIKQPLPDFQALDEVA